MSLNQALEKFFRESCKGMQIWLSILVEYDKDGMPHIIRAFAKPAKESTVKQIKGQYVPKAKPGPVAEEQLFG